MIILNESNGENITDLNLSLLMKNYSTRIAAESMQRELTLCTVTLSLCIKLILIGKFHCFTN